jgi:hypothetical protein
VRSLADESFNVVLVEDCCAAGTDELHRHELAIINMIYCHVVSSDELRDIMGIVGEPLSVTDGVYRIRMPALGDIEVPVSRVSSMVPADGAAAGIDPPADQPGKSR